jgi:hypothetical protein
MLVEHLIKFYHALWRDGKGFFRGLHV